MTNPEKLWYPQARSTAYFFYRQEWHLLYLLVFVPLTFFLSSPFLENSAWLGLNSAQWFWISIILSIVHQVIVWIVFRLQLGWAPLTQLFGKADLVAWGAIFFPLFLGRIFAQVGFAQATQATLALAKPLAIGISIVLILSALYTLWSVVRYFGLIRAMVGDHFRLRFREMPLETRGIYKYSSNAMYTYVLLLFWAIALINRSLPGLFMAAFHHSYVWVHYYCTEKPDMEIIYKNNFS